MPPTVTPQEFIDKWRRVELKERSASQEHFIDLCRLVWHKTPVELDPKGDFFTFEYGVSKQKGDDGWADFISDEEILDRLLAFNTNRS
jgi:hypothetical protein